MPKKQYLSLRFRCSDVLSEILIAELAEIGYDSFWEQEDGFEAYIDANDFREEALQKVIRRYAKLGEISYHTAQLEEKNWNVEWESNFEPIIVENQCLVRADFHQIAKDYPYEIVINPKMSFGTGHHATTYLMLSWQLELDQQSKKVMDAGCGTGILAIMARLKGANEIVAFDNNEWAVDNSRECFALNHCPDIRMFLGTITDIPKDDQYDIILANINRNVLLEELPLYAARLRQDGALLLSGFYNYDAPRIETKAADSGLIVRGQKEKNDWVALHLSF